MMNGACQVVRDAGILTEDFAVYYDRLQKFVRGRVISRYVREVLSRLENEDSAIRHEAEVHILRALEALLLDRGAGTAAGPAFFEARDQATAFPDFAAFLAREERSDYCDCGVIVDDVHLARGDDCAHLFSIANQLNRRPVRKDTPPGEGLVPMASIKLIKGNDEVVNKSKRLWLEKFKDIYTSQ